MNYVTTVEELKTLYGEPLEAALVKETAHVTAEYRAYIEASPFCALASVGPEGMDCTPRGDKPGFVRVHDERTLMMPDRRGNNRIDTLKNIVRDPRVALMFVIPGHGGVLRVNGEARITTDNALCESFAVEGKSPRSVIVIKTQAVYLQCSRAVKRAELWDPARYVNPGDLPTPGQILAAISENRIDGKSYDAEWPERARKTMW